MLSLQLSLTDRNSYCPCVVMKSDRRCGDKSHAIAVAFCPMVKLGIFKDSSSESTALCLCVVVNQNGSKLWFAYVI